MFIVHIFIFLASNPKCYFPGDPQLNSTAWFAQYIGSFVSFLTLDDVVTFGSESVKNQHWWKFWTDAHFLFLPGFISWPTEVLFSPPCRSFRSSQWTFRTSLFSTPLSYLQTSQSTTPPFYINRTATSTPYCEFKSIQCVAFSSHKSCIFL